MKYRDILKLYKDGKLSDEERAEVEKEIEKQEAISAFLYDEEDDLFEGASLAPEDEDITAREDRARQSEGPTEQEFARAIRKSIRRAFMKMGAVITAIVLAVVLFSQTLLPKLVDRFYFDPTQSIYEDEMDEDKNDANVLETGIRVYSELFVPGCNLDAAYIEREGFGNYSFVVSASTWYSSMGQPIYAGNIRKGKITFYNPTAMQTPPGNAFEWTTNLGEYSYDRDLTSQVEELSTELDEIWNEDGTEAEYEYHTWTGMGGDPELSREFLSDLDENKKYQAYVTFDKVMSYEDVYEFCTEKYDISDSWLGIVDQMLGCDVIGMYANFIGGPVYDPIEKYPNLWGKEVEGDVKIYGSLMTQEEAKKHFISMITFLQDHEDFSKMMGVDSRISGSKLEDIKEYVSANPLRVYGISFISTKDELLKLIDDEAVYSIGTEIVR